MTPISPKPPSPSITRRRAARLAFVQYLYQQKLGGGSASAAEYIAQTAERMPKVVVDKSFLKKLLAGFADEEAALQRRLTQQMEKGRAFDRVSPLMQALLEAGAYELIYYPETSAKILLDEYVALAAEFFDDPELGFVNGTLQELADALRPTAPRSGFTLMEMAVVLVVVGLMVGGVLVGQDMMRAADRNALIGEIEKVQHMVDTFRTKYESLPGDMPDAYNYWGATAACNNTSVAIDNSGCNGDGDGQWDVANEKYRAWHHLDLADLAEGVWNRATSLASVACVPGQIGPELKVASRPMTIWFDYQSSANVLRISGEASTCPYSNATNTLNPADAYAIDDKIDDGLPTTGNFRSFSTTTCIDTTPNPDIYNVDVEQTWDCQPYVIYE